VSVAETEHGQDPILSLATKPSVQSFAIPVQESAEVTALKLELSTLSTSHSSIQNTLLLLQAQLNDLKRMNNGLQEENESYMILLRERTLNGQYDVTQVGGMDEDEEEDDDDETDKCTDDQSMRSSSRSALDPVDEAEEYNHATLAHELDPAHDLERELEKAGRRGGYSSARRRAISTPHRGESLAGLPITGPGLDLAAELGRAENKDILSGTTSPTPDGLPSRHKRGKKSTSSANGGRKVNSLASELAASTTKSDMETLRSEVKALKDANRALSLYASKIIDRIIAQEGFEHVLSVDYEPQTPAANIAFPTVEPEKSKRGRSQSFFGFGSSSAAPTPAPAPVEKLTTFDSLPPKSPLPPPTASPNPSTPAPASAITNTAAAAAARGDKRRSFSLDWSPFSLFSSEKKTPEPSNLRPLSLKPGSQVIANARKLDTTEDEEDQRERERLNATMKLMGIEKPSTPSPPPQLIKTYSEPAPPSTEGSTQQPPVRPSRWSLFRSKSTRTDSAPASGKSSPQPSAANPMTLTQEALEHAEAEEKLAALDAHEKTLSDQYAKGSGSSSFTEPPARGSRRGRRSVNGSAQSGSASTVWSAGMSKEGDDD
jgi:hypothetical protein